MLLVYFKITSNFGCARLGCLDSLHLYFIICTCIKENIGNHIIFQLALRKAFKMDVEMTPLNSKNTGSYQNDYVPDLEQEEPKRSSMSTKVIYMSLAFLLLATIGIIVVIVSGSGREKIDLLIAPKDDYLLQSGAASYCKTSCASSCASYDVSLTINFSLTVIFRFNSH